MMRNHRRQGLLVVLAALLLSLAASSSSATWSWTPRAEVLTSAHPTEVDPEVSDTATHVGSRWARSFQAEAAALASATCDGCRGNASTLDVVYARKVRKATLDNVANAWAQCTGCHATAVSVQVVVARRAKALVANNRALSVNATCTACHVRAAAFQLVVVDPDVSRLSRADIAALRQWMRDQVAMPDPQARLDRGHGRDSLARLVNEALDSRTLLFDADRG
jgi:hypothetical protein